MNWSDYWTFYHASVVLFFLAVLFLLIRWIFFRRRSGSKEPRLRFKHWNRQFAQSEEQLQDLLEAFPALPKEAAKLIRKRRKQDQKAEKQDQQSQQAEQTAAIQKALDAGLSSKEVLQQNSNRIYVLDFKGNVMASEVEQLRDEITFLIQVATPSDEIVLRLNSPGGAVAQYGLASSQVARLRQAGLKCVVCVDVVAASGGYMMAAAADRIIAAPFAFIGSIGVVAGMPNFHRILQKNEVDYHLFTAGKYKRTVTPFTEVREEHKEKLQENLESIHEAFKNHIRETRPELALDEVATGEVWLGSEALGLKLIDELSTSDDYLLQKAQAGCEVIVLSTEAPGSPMEKILRRTEMVLSRLSPWGQRPEATFWGGSSSSSLS